MGGNSALFYTWLRGFRSRRTLLKIKFFTSSKTESYSGRVGVFWLIAISVMTEILI